MNWSCQHAPSRLILLWASIYLTAVIAVGSTQPDASAHEAWAEAYAYAYCVSRWDPKNPSYTTPCASDTARRPSIRLGTGSAIVCTTPLYKDVSISKGFSEGGDPKDAYARASATGTDFFIVGPPNSNVDIILEIREVGTIVPPISFPDPPDLPPDMMPTFNQLFADRAPETPPDTFNFNVHLELDTSIAVGGVVDPTSLFNGTATLQFDDLELSGRLYRRQ